MNNKKVKISNKLLQNIKKLNQKKRPKSVLICRKRL